MAAQSNSSQPQQVVKSTERVLAEADQQWLFDETELLSTPSIRDGMSVGKEKEMRAKGVNFIRQVGIMLKLPELTLSTASIFFNRFLMRMSLVDRPGVKALHHYTLAATCLFVATKVEESCRKIMDFVVACCRVAQNNPNLVLDKESKDFWRWRDTIMLNEDVLLEMLCFDMTIEPPHKQLFEMLKFYRLENNKSLRNAAWAFVTDSNMTQLCLICTSRTIAVAALFASARMCQVKIPDSRENKPWWEEQGVTSKDVLKAINYMGENYEVPPQKTGEDGVGSNNVYVGLLIDPEKKDGKNGLEGVLENTRLKHDEQRITSPVAVFTPDEVNKPNNEKSNIVNGNNQVQERQESVVNDGGINGTKRSRHQQENGTSLIFPDSKKPRLSDPTTDDKSTTLNIQESRDDTTASNGAKAESNVTKENNVKADVVREKEDDVETSIVREKEDASEEGEVLE